MHELSEDQLIGARDFLQQASVEPNISSRALDKLQNAVCHKYQLPLWSRDQLIAVYHSLLDGSQLKESPVLSRWLRLKKIRSSYGLVVVSVMTKPYPCPGKCTFCPAQAGMPKSYLKDEPASMRARNNLFDPYRQVFSRLTALSATGHPTAKISLRLIGGTWSFYPKNYQTWFIKKLISAANQFPGAGEEGNKSLSELQLINQTATCRIVELSVETRPDYLDADELRRLRRLGVTKVEIGVQSLSDESLIASKRGHTTEDTVRATKILKNAGFKVSYQMMINLPKATPADDIRQFKELFSDERFCPDHLKIYPLAVVKEAPLYRDYLAGTFRPYNEEQVFEVIKAAKSYVPEYCRIERIIRDIPSADIVEGGAKVSNMRQRLQNQGFKCRCIRCREIGESQVDLSQAKIFRQDYLASDGHEIFLSFENPGRSEIYSLLRLRIVNTAHRPIVQELKGAALIREMHTYGRQLNFGERDDEAVQHHGFGRRLLEESERIAREEFGCKKIAVIAGIGVRNYFVGSGYQLESSYMSKKLV